MQVHTINRQFYTMNDLAYRDFIISILTHLEPFFERKGVGIINELDEFGEVTFISSGIVGIGYEVNKIQKL
jgi:hypothetical protein